MIWLRLHDPARTPAHWTELVHPGQYTVFVLDATNRAPRDADGQPFRCPDGTESSPCAALCDDLAEAERFALGVVTRHPELCCEIYDYLGKSNPPLQVLYNPAVRHKHMGSRHGRRLALTGAAVASVGITLALIDLSHDFKWMWGYIFGLKCMVVGGTLLTLGLLEWYAHRGEQNVSSTKD